MFPTNIGELSERISKDGRDRNGDRFKEASKELSVFGQENLTIFSI